MKDKFEVGQTVSFVLFGRERTGTVSRVIEDILSQFAYDITPDGSSFKVTRLGSEIKLLNQEAPASE